MNNFGRLDYHETPKGHFREGVSGIEIHREMPMERSPTESFS